MRGGRSCGLDATAVKQLEERAHASIGRSLDRLLSEIHHCHALFPAGREIVDTVVDEQARAQGNVERSLQRGEDLRVGLAGTDVTTDDPRPYPGPRFESPAQQHRPLSDL